MLKPKPKTIVAIDPDLHASGMAAWCTESKSWLFAKSVSIESIKDTLSLLKPEETVIYVECGWMNKKSNYRKTAFRGVSENIAMKVGENHATGKIIIKILEAAGYTVEKFKPLAKGFFKTSTGWTIRGREYVKSKSGLEHRMNDDVRDAIYTVLWFR